VVRESADRSSDDLLRLLLGLSADERLDVVPVEEPGLRRAAAPEESRPSSKSFTAAARRTSSRNRSGVSFNARSVSSGTWSSRGRCPLYQTSRRLLAAQLRRAGARERYAAEREAQMTNPNALEDLARQAIEGDREALEGLVRLLSR